MEKRGLSNLIATVLIVLLALAAVAIVWSFIKAPLEDSGRSIGFGTKCLETEAKPVSCVHNSTTDFTTVTVQHSRGQNLADIIVIVDYTDESTNVTRTGAVELFATKTVSIASPNGMNAVKAGAAPILGDGEGNEEICEEVLTSINCDVV